MPEPPARSLPNPGFSGDDGAVPPELAAALAAYDRGARGGPAALQEVEVLEVLQHARLLVPVVAVLGEVEHDSRGLARDKTSDMATVLMRGRDGRTALLAFTGQAPMLRWRADARPVPVTTPDAARAAVQEGADAIVVDVAGPVTFVVEGEDLRALADGFTVRAVAGRSAWVRATPPLG